MAVYGYHRSKCTEDKDTKHKYLSTDWKKEIHLQGLWLFMQKLSQMQKDSEKLGIVEIHIIRGGGGGGGREKLLSHVFGIN